MGLAAGARAALLAAAAGASPLRAGLDELSPAVALAGEPPTQAPSTGPVLVELALDNLAGGGNGTVVIAVRGEWAPLGAARFLELVDRGFYDGHRFFRAVPRFVAQWGLHPDPQEIERSSQYAPAIEDDPLMPGVGNSRGRVTFAAAGPGTRTVQAFVNLADNPHLDSPEYSFAPFGEVVSGMESVDRIFAGYGESVDQSVFHTEGDASAAALYPLLSRISAARRAPELAQPRPAAEAPQRPAPAPPLLLPYESLVASPGGDDFDGGPSDIFAAAAAVAALAAVLMGLGAATGLRKRLLGSGDTKSV